MARLVRLDSTGHTELAQWTAGDADAHEAAVAAFRRELDRGMIGSMTLADGTAEVVRADELPAGDRVAHLLLALREDEEGFATVANIQFSGAVWRVRRRLDGRSRPALDAARELARAL